MIVLAGHQAMEFLQHQIPDKLGTRHFRNGDNKCFFYICEWNYDYRLVPMMEFLIHLHQIQCGLKATTSVGTIFVRSLTLNGTDLIGGSENNGIIVSTNNGFKLDNN
jgi:hypothetical protein